MVPEWLNSQLRYAFTTKNIDQIKLLQGSVNVWMRYYSGTERGDVWADVRGSITSPVPSAANVESFILSTDL